MDPDDPAIIFIDCLEDARKLLYGQDIPKEVLEGVLGAWITIGDSDLDEREADGLLWGFVAGRIFADLQRIDPLFYSHRSMRQ